VTREKVVTSRVSFAQQIVERASIDNMINITDVCDYLLLIVSKSFGKEICGRKDDFRTHNVR